MAHRHQAFDRRIGVCTHFERREQGWKVEHLLPLIVAADIGAVRQEIRWAEVESTPGCLRIPDVARDWVDRVHDAGLGIIMLLCYGNPVYDDELDVEAYARYAGFVARELRGRRILAYELWNEPTNFTILQRLGGDWSGRQPAPWMQRYAELVAAGARAIRAADPDAVIITNPGAPQAFHLMDRHREALCDLDGISHHPYPVRLPPETLPLGGGEVSAHDGVACADDDHGFASLFTRTRAHAQRTLGRDLAMYATEMGYSTACHHRRPGWAAGFTSHAQACYDLRLLIQAFAAGVRTPCIYDFMDDGTERDEIESNFGLVRHETLAWAPKPSYAAVQNLARAMGGDWLHLSEAPASLEVDMHPLSDTCIWMRQAVEPFIRVHGPQIAWFALPDGWLSLVWMAGRAGGDTTPPLGRIVWEAGRGHVHPLTMTDLVSGEALPIRCEEPPACGSYSMRSILTDIPIADAPIAVRWTRNGQG